MEQQQQRSSGPTKPPRSDFLARLTIGKLGSALLAGGVLVFLCGLFEVLDYRRQNDMLTKAGSLLFVVGVILAAVSMFKRGRV